MTFERLRQSKWAEKYARLEEDHARLEEDSARLEEEGARLQRELGWLEERYLREDVSSERHAVAARERKRWKKEYTRLAKEQERWEDKCDLLEAGREWLEEKRARMEAFAPWNENREWLEHTRSARFLVVIAVRLLPPSERDRYLEEFRAELLDVPRDTRRRHAVSLLRGVCVLRLRREPKNKGADAAVGRAKN